jgi:predicted RND superfamily exporter protein
VFFGADNPQLKAFDALQRIYSREDNLTLVLQPKSGTVFTPKLLMGMRELTDASWKIPFTTRVDSLTNFQNSVAVEDDLTVADLVPKRTPLDAADLVGEPPDRPRHAHRRHQPHAHPADEVRG